MILVQALFNYLSTQPGLAALVGDRVFPDTVPEGATLPTLTYQRVSGEIIRTMGAPTTGARPRVQFDVTALTRLQADAVALALQGALEGYSGTMGGLGGLVVHAAQQQNDLSEYDELTKEYRRVLDFFIWHAPET